jgi:hypothetical protein
LVSRGDIGRERCGIGEEVSKRSVGWGPTEGGGLDGNVHAAEAVGGADNWFWEVLGLIKLFDTIYMGIATRCQEKSMEAKTTLLVSTVWMP